MFTPNKVKDIRKELSEIVVLLNDKKYGIALACVSHASSLLDKLSKEIQERLTCQSKS